jgi:hypothetical protein
MIIINRELVAHDLVVFVVVAVFGAGFAEGINKFVEVDASVTVDIHFFDHIFDLFFGEVLPQTLQHGPQVRRRDVPPVVLVEHPERIPQLLLLLFSGEHVVGVRARPRRPSDIYELLEADVAVAVHVHLLEHLLELLGARELSQRSHHSAQLLLGDAAVAVLVEESERLPELLHLALGDLRVSRTDPGRRLHLLYLGLALFILAVGDGGVGVGVGLGGLAGLQAGGGVGQVVGVAPPEAEGVEEEAHFHGRDETGGGRELRV